MSTTRRKRSLYKTPFLFRLEMAAADHSQCKAAKGSVRDGNRLFKILYFCCVHSVGAKRGPKREFLRNLYNKKANCVTPRKTMEGWLDSWAYPERGRTINQKVGGAYVIFLV